MAVVELVAALLPAIVLLVIIYKNDTADKEPWGLVIGVFFLGAASALVASILELLVDEVFTSIFSTDTFIYGFLSVFLGVALIEELCKMGAAYLPTWKNKNFNYVFDGVVYGVAAALGFAALENVFYVVGEDGALEIAAMRALLSVPGHMCDGVFMGVFIGYAKLYKYQSNTRKQRRFMVFALAAPVVEHLIYDGLCEVLDDDSAFLIIGFSLIVYAISIVIVVKTHGKHDIRIPLPVEEVSSPPQEQPQAQEVAEVQVNYCPECGTRFLEGAKFCIQCGAPRSRPGR